jgi:hypothetical protein
MKKAMICLLSFVSLLLTTAFLFYKNAIHFYIRQSNLSEEEEIGEFEELSEKYDATIIRTDRIWNQCSEVLYKSGIFSNNYFENANIQLVSGVLPQESNEFLATFITGNKHQSGKIRDLFGDYKLIIEP